MVATYVSLLPDQFIYVCKALHPIDFLSALGDPGTPSLWACYGLSSPLAALLVVGLHNGIVHLNCPPGQKYAPIAIQQDLVEDFVEHVMQAASATAAVGLAEAEVMVPLHNMARSRVHCDKLSKSLGGIHANAAHGELAGILGIWGRTVDGKLGVSFPWMRT
ncbi:hypothetical protein B0H14DRAFT_3442072 [Mycena olivaceomarginata]|nr:hypothetical protein B0H14DRAFT_3442072 [Mycena olivaceomarginata]